MPSAARSRAAVAAAEVVALPAAAVDRRSCRRRVRAITSLNLAATSAMAVSQSISSNDAVGAAAQRAGQPVRTVLVVVDAQAFSHV